MPLISGTDFVMVPVDDLEEAKRFYSEVLELEQSKAYGRRPGGEWETGTLTLQILETEAFGLGKPNPNKNPIALHTDDYEGTKATLTERGVEFVHEIDSGVCWMGFFADPSGNSYCLHHRYAPPDALPPGV